MQNANGLPTQTVYRLFDKLSFPLSHGDKNVLGAIFQRACLVGDFDGAMAILEVHLPQELTEADIKKLELASKIAKPEVLGVAVETLAEVAQSPLSAQKDKVLATQALHELYGEKERINDTGLTDKIILNLVG